MKHITIRNIPDEIERIVKKEARVKGLSLNKAFISLLERATGVRSKGKKKKIPYHDLDHLFGVWAKEDETSFNNNLELQRKNR
ncbi:MAG: hypothetical protein JRC57_05380 [Deltaproteobacteria bacterium]|nr:hypothetical protein [Deltaproteobacteria bacterium]MBW2652500.1 hypothetical protein [Deltaproteobacteria bacterium]